MEAPTFIYPSVPPVAEEKDPRTQLAWELFQMGYAKQMDGRLEDAVLLYQQSIKTLPSAEAYTFLGWTYRFQGKLEEAIEECKNAILIDPTLGNPYNDIGAYLIEQGKPEEAISWLERAAKSKRYASYHYAWFNLGRAHASLENWESALEAFEKAAALAPDYAPAVEAAQKIRRMMQ